MRDARSGLHTISIGVMGGVCLASLLCVGLLPQRAEAITLNDMYRQSGVKYGELITRGGSVIKIARPLAYGNPVAGIVVGVASAYVALRGEQALNDLNVQTGSENKRDLPHPDSWDDAESPPDGTRHTGGYYRYTASGEVYQPFPSQEAAGIHHCARIAGVVAGNYTWQGEFDSISGSNVIRCVRRHNTLGTYEAAAAGATVSFTSGSYCDEGYALDGTRCVAVSPPATQWEPDGVRTISPKGDGSGWEAHWRDRDQLGGTVPNPIVIRGLDESGDPTQWEVTALPDGGVSVRVLTEFEEGGNTHTFEHSHVTNAHGIVTHVTNQYYENTTINSHTTHTPAPEVTPVSIAEGSFSVEFPEFCGWATPVCSFIDWFTAEPSPPETPETPVTVVEDPWEEYDSGLPVTGTCPAPVLTSYMDTEIEIRFDQICWGAETVFRPLIIALSLIAAGFILVGARS